MKLFTNFKATIFWVMLTSSVSILYSQNFQLLYSEDFAEWYEVPESTLSAIETEPFFSNSCHWTVSTKSGKPIPFLIQTLPETWPFLLPFKETLEVCEAVGPERTIPVVDGWLAAYNRQNGGDVYWFNEDRSKRQFVASYWINQFVLNKNGNEVIAAQGSSRNGEGRVLRFYREVHTQGWKVENLVDFEFGEVYGIAQNWLNGILVYSQKGWFKIQDDGKVVEVSDNKEVSGITIAADGNTVFLGGEYFVRKLNLQTKKVKVLAPSPNFVDAMRQWPAKKFKAALELIRKK